MAESALMDIRMGSFHHLRSMKYFAVSVMTSSVAVHITEHTLTMIYIYFIDYMYSHPSKKTRYLLQVVN